MRFASNGSRAFVAFRETDRLPFATFASTRRDSPVPARVDDKLRRQRQIKKHSFTLYY